MHQALDRIPGVAISIEDAVLMDDPVGEVEHVRGEGLGVGPTARGEVIKRHRAPLIEAFGVIRVAIDGARIDDMALVQRGRFFTRSSR